MGHTKNYDEAISKFRKAIAIEDKLNYNEPPDWFFSIRLTLGHWQNIAGYYKEAEKTYTEDLDLFKENGWALKGLQNSLIAQGKSEQAIVVEKRFNKAWKHADIIIQSSRVY